MKKLLSSLVLALTLCVQANAQKWSGNPILMGFHADPEVMYSHLTNRYYIYSTTDGTPGWGGHDFSVFSSTDLKTWTDEGKMLDVAFLPGAERVIQLAKASGLYKGDL